MLIRADHFHRSEHESPEATQSSGDAELKKGEHNVRPFVALDCV
jgi:hypothetical protein